MLYIIKSVGFYQEHQEQKRLFCGILVKQNLEQVIKGWVDNGGCQWGRFFLTTIERVDFVEFVGATNNELLALKNKELDVKTLYSKIGSAVTDYNRESVI